MRSVYRPALRVPGEWLAADPAVPRGRLPVPFLDEDEATLAVAACAPLLAAARVAPQQLRRVVVSSRTWSGFGPVLAAALGVPAESVEEGAALLYGQVQHPAPGEGPVLHVHSDAPRGGRVPAEGPGEGAVARARLTGSAIPVGPDIEVSVAAWTPDRDTFERLGQAEAGAPKRTTMAAYVPRASWERSMHARYRLEGSACKAGHLEFPPRTRCGRCGSAAAHRPLPRPGVLETFTVVAKGAGPSEFEPLQDVVGEYAVGVATFGGARAPGLFTETPLEGIRIGAKVDVVFRRLYAQDGEWRYGLKFRGL